MQKYQKIPSAFRVIVFFAITSIFLTITSCKTKTDLSSIPVALVNLRGATLEFSCVNMDDCFADIDLTQQISELNTSDASLSINSAYYIDSSLLYIFLDQSGGEFLLKINPKTGDAKILDISEMMPLMAIRPVHGKLVIAWTNGTVGIVQDDFTLKKVEPGKGIYHFTESENESLLAYGEPVYKEGKMWASIFIVNVNSGDFEEKIFEGPEAEQSGTGQPFVTGQKYIFGSILNASSDLNYIYYLYQVGKDQETVTPLMLAKFDLNTHEEVLSLPSSLAMVSSPSERYRDIWYYERRDLEGSSIPLLLNISTLEPILDLSKLVQGETSDKILISPYGDSFLVGTNSHVNIVSFDGKIEQTYAIPSLWIDQDYALLKYYK